jgi:hypothetical protein
MEPALSLNSLVRKTESLTFSKLLNPYGDVPEKGQRVHTASEFNIQFGIVSVLVCCRGHHLFRPFLYVHGKKIKAHLV